MNFEKNELEKFYQRAKKRFEECINNENNSFLKDEIDIPLEEIVTHEKFVLIKYTGTSTEEYTIEVRLALSGMNEEEFGYYSIILDKDLKEIDDYLTW